MRYLNLTLKGAACLLTILLLLVRCSEVEPTPVQEIATRAMSTDSLTRIYIVPPRTHVIDGEVLGLQPGDVIGLDASIAYGNLLFKNIVGSSLAPIVIKNIGGTATITATGLSFGLKMR